MATNSFADAQPSAEPEYEPEPEPEPESEPEGEPQPVAEPMSLSTEAVTAWTAVYSVVIVATIVCNVVLITSMLRRRKSDKKNCLSKASDVFLVSLLAARTTVAVFVMPSRILGLFPVQDVGSVICKLCEFAATGSAASSVLSTCAVAVAKLREAKTSAKPQTFSQRRAWLNVVALWSAGHVYAVRQPFLNDIVELRNLAGDTIVQCGIGEEFRTAAAVFLLLDLFCLFVLPSCLIVTMAVWSMGVTSRKTTENTWFAMSDATALQQEARGGVGREMRTTQKSCDAKLPEVDQSTICKAENQIHAPRSYAGVEEKSRKEKSSHESDRQLKNERSLRYMTVLIIFVFIGCYATVYIWKTLVFFQADCVFRLSPDRVQHLELTLYIWTFFNPLFNVAIYIFFREDLRKSLSERFTRRSVKVSPRTQKAMKSLNLRG